MEFIVFVFIMCFLAALQTAIPYLVKRTVVFGVSVPERFIHDERISKLKRTYSLIVSVVSLLVILFYFMFGIMNKTNMEQLVLYGTIIQFIIIFLSLALYFYFHSKMKEMKRMEKWGQSKNQVQVADLTVREEDEVLPWYVYLLPILISIGLIIYTIVQYDLLPDQIPTHWGINGEPDAFTNKTYFSAIMMPLILLVMQVMFLGIQIGYQKSGVKIHAENVSLSRHRQLTLRKYSSWFMLGVTLFITILFTFFHLRTIHPNLVNHGLSSIIPLIVMGSVFLGTIIFAIQVGRSDKKFFETVGDTVEQLDEDRYWKGGLFYFNKNDPSIFVEKRFGVGWTINFSNPKAYFIVLLPIIIILALAFLT